MTSLEILRTFALDLLAIAKDYWFILAPAGGALLWLARYLARRAIRAHNEALGLWRELVAKVSRIDAALGPNGGKSIYDRLERIEGEIKSTAAEVAHVRARIDADQRTAPEARVELDEHGRVTVVNRAFETLTERGASDLIGLGIYGIVHRSDRERVVNEWTLAVKDRRWFESELRLVARDGTAIRTRMYGEPMRLSGGGHVLGWLVQFSALEAAEGVQ